MRMVRTRAAGWQKALVHPLRIDRRRAWASVGNVVAELSCQA
jgi:hypothetical protein